MGKLERKDHDLKIAAIVIQKRWRKVKKVGKQGTGHIDFDSFGRARIKNVAKMHSKTVSAPAYFGESCLWVPFEQWNLQPPPPYMYSASCKSRGEFVYIPRSAIEETITRFSPWLCERFEFFRESVVNGLEEMMGSGGSAREPLAARPYKRVGTFDSLVPEDDVTLGPFYTKTLLRSASTAHPGTLMRKAHAEITADHPAMPRVPVCPTDL